MANIEGARRIDDERIPLAETLEGVIIPGIRNGESVRVNAEQMKSILVPTILTPEQKENALSNIGSLTSESVADMIDYNEIEL